MPARNESLMRALVEHNAPYWAGEYAVARRYFADGVRTREIDIRWIELQMFKEWTGSGVYGDRSVTLTSVIRQGLDELLKIERGDAVKDLDRISGLIQFGVDEFNHFSILYKLYRMVAPDRKRSVFEMGDLPEAKKMVDMRQHVRETHPLGDTIVDLTEGGGLGMYFGIAKAFEGHALNDADRIVDDFARMTIRDETSHMKGRFQKALGLGITPSQWEEVDRGLSGLFEQKLIERNEQFGNVYSRAELDAMAKDVGAGRAYVKTNLGFLSRELALAA